MTYFQFVQAVEQQVKAGVKKDHEVRIHTARKNNGVWRKGLSISESGINVAPTIYLEEYYQQFQKVCRSYYIQGEVKIEERLMEYVRQLSVA